MQIEELEVYGNHPEKPHSCAGEKQTAINAFPVNMPPYLWSVHIGHLLIWHRLLMEGAAPEQPEQKHNQEASTRD